MENSIDSSKMEEPVLLSAAGMGGAMTRRMPKCSEAPMGMDTVLPPDRNTDMQDIRSGRLSLNWWPLACLLLIGTALLPHLEVVRQALHPAYQSLRKGGGNPS